jgi:hypothetical protein
MSGRNIRAQRRQAEESRWIGFAPAEDDDDEPDEWSDAGEPEQQEDEGR